MPVRLRNFIPKALNIPVPASLVLLLPSSPYETFDSLHRVHERLIHPFQMRMLGVE